MGIGESAGLASAVAWAIISVVMRSFTDRLGPVLVNGLRCGFAAVTLAVLATALGDVRSFDSMPMTRVGLIVASGVLGQGLGDLTFVRSMKLLGAARALPISSVYPLLTLVLAALFLGERVSVQGIGGTLLVIVGISLLAFPYGSLWDSIASLGAADRRGLLLALGAACLWASATIVLKLGLGDSSLVVTNLIRMVTATVLLFGMEVSHTHRLIPLKLSLRPLVILGLAGSLSAFSSLGYIAAVYYAGAARATVLSSTSPLFGLPLSLLFLHEKVNSRIVGGTLLAVIGIWLVLLG